MLKQLMSLARLDLSPAHRPPAPARMVLVTAASIIGSLVADALLVVIGEAVFPSTKGYAHFRVSDYTKLTVIGVIIACVAWPAVVRSSSAPRWLFFRLAILVTLFLWLPDLYILHQGQTAKAVAVLMVMHLAIALVTYNLLVHAAPVRPDRPTLTKPLARGPHAAGSGAGAGGPFQARPTGTRLAVGRQTRRLGRGEVAGGPEGRAGHVVQGGLEFFAESLGLSSTGYGNGSLRGGRSGWGRRPGARYGGARPAKSGRVWARPEEGLGVRVARVRAHLFLVAHLHDAPEVHDGDPVRHIADDRKVVGDEHIREVELALEGTQQAQDLGLSGNIQR